MKLLFLPSLPKEQDTKACNLLNTLLKKDFNIVFYLPKHEMERCLIYNFLNGNIIKNIIKNELIDKNRILFVGKGCLIEEAGALQKENIGAANISSKCAVPGNFYCDFIPAVLDYYRKEQIEIEDILLFLKGEKSEKEIYEWVDGQETFYSNEIIKELENYAKANQIRYVRPIDSWESCLVEEIKKTSLEKSMQYATNLDILYQPFFKKLP